MEQSDHTTPRVFSLMWMVSHPGSLAKQFIHSTSENFFMQMVLKSLVNSRAVFLMFMRMVSYPELIFFLLWIVSHPGHSTRNARGGGDL